MTRKPCRDWQGDMRAWRSSAADCAFDARAAGPRCSDPWIASETPISAQNSRCLVLVLLYDGIVTLVPACQIAASSRMARSPPKRLQTSKNVQTNPDRKSRRDRLPGHQDCPP